MKIDVVSALDLSPADIARWTSLQEGPLRLDSPFLSPRWTQAVARALGGQVVRNAAGWGLGTAATHWQRDRPWMEPVRPMITLMAAHNEQVTRMPEGAECLGGSDFCPIGSMQIGQHIWTTQYHPEMPLVFLQALLGYLADKLDAATLERAHASLAQAADAPLFGQWMVQFLEHARNTRP